MKLHSEDRSREASYSRRKARRRDYRRSKMYQLKLNVSEYVWPDKSDKETPLEFVIELLT
jgi:hypothetical protein